MSQAALDDSSLLADCASSRLTRPPRAPRQQPGTPAAGPLEIASLDSDARGVGRLRGQDGSPGKVVFVEGALPGERITYRSHRVKAAYEQAAVADILRPSASRVTPRCGFFGLCGGCSMQHLDARAQLAIKQRVLEDSLWRLAKLRPDVVLRPIAGPDWGYRYRARLTVRRVAAKGGVLIGFHERKSRYVADMTSCQILPPDVSALLTPLRGLVGCLSIAARVPQIELAIGQETTALVLRILEPLTSADEDALRAFADRHAVQFWLQPGGPDTAAPFYPAERALAYALPEFGITLPFRPTDFTQVNPAMNRVLVSRALNLLDAQPGERLLDLFCGIGNFTLPMATTRGAGVMGIEGSQALVARARDNARHNRLAARTEFACRNLFEVTADDVIALGRFHRWLIDPPREGALAVARALAELSQRGGQTAAWLPRRIVYVSCHPATLARDAGLLVHGAGYRLSGAGIVNMFPHTSHVESIAVFDRD